MINSRKLVGQTLTYGISSILGRMINYLLVPIHTYFFSNPSDFGVLTELYAYAAFLNVVLSFGMETTYFREINLNKNNNSVYNKLYSFIITLAIVWSILGWICAPYLAGFIRFSSDKIIYLKILVIILATDALSALPFAKLRHMERARLFTLLRLANILVNIVLNVLFLSILGADVLYILWANLIANLLTLGIVIILYNNDFKYEFDLSYYKKVIPFALPLTIMGLAGMVNEVMDRIFLKFWLPENFYPGLSNMDALGIYGASYKLSIFMTLAIQSFRYAAEPFFFKQIEQQNKEVYADVMDWFIIVTCLIFLVVSNWLDVLQYFLSTKIYRQGVIVVPVLLLANMFLGIYHQVSIWFKLIGNSFYGLGFTLFGSVVTVLANYLLIPEFGYLGCATATLLCYFSMTLTNLFWGYRNYRIPYRFTKNGLWIIYTLILFGISHQFQSSNNLAWLFSHVIIPLVYLSSILIVEKNSLSIILDFFRKKNL